MNGLGKPFRKNPIQKINKKLQARKRIFVQTPFSHSTLNLERKHFTPQNHSLFRSVSSFGVTKYSTPI